MKEYKRKKVKKEIPRPLFTIHIFTFSLFRFALISHRILGGLDRLGVAEIVAFYRFQVSIEFVYQGNARRYVELDYLVIGNAVEVFDQ